MFRNLATHPEVREAQLLAYDEQIFRARSNEFYRDLSGILNETRGQKSRERNRTIDIRVSEVNAEGISQDEVRLPYQGKQVSVGISEDGKQIQIGEYAFSDAHFGRFVYYMVNGGLFGWARVPSFANGAKRTLRSSKHPVYSTMQGEMEALRRHFGK